MRNGWGGVWGGGIRCKVGWFWCLGLINVECLVWLGNIKGLGWMDGWDGMNEWMIG